MKIRGVITAAGLSAALATGATAVAQAGVSGHRLDARVMTVSASVLDSSLPSPNGAYFALASDNSAGIATTRLYSRSGKELMSYSPSSSSGASPLAWSRDSRYLAVSVLLITAKADSEELVIIDTHTMTAKAILDENVGAASFAPAGSGKPADELVFDEYSQTLNNNVNLFETTATGGTVRQLTTDGVSAAPVWGRLGIIFDRLAFRKDASPARQLWLLSGGKARQLTHMKLTSNEDGVIPIAVSANGNRLIAASGAETIGWTAWEIQLKPFISKAVVLPGNNPMLTHFVYSDAISRDGTKLLVSSLAAKNSTKLVTEWVPFGGGKPHKVTNPALQTIWNW